MLIGLVLTGGGARAAYQVGALRAIEELTSSSTPFPVMCGVSAGAINSAALAARADDFHGGVEHLLAIWRSLTPDRVYRTDSRTLARTGARWIGQLSGGGLLGRSMTSLLDTEPLRRLLTDRVAVSRIHAHIESGVLAGFGVTATSYRTGVAVTFFDGGPEVEPWLRIGRVGVRSYLTSEHVMASSAIPVFFPPVLVEGTHYGDGCVRLGAPLSPVIHMGADRLIAIGVRNTRSPIDHLLIEPSESPEPFGIAEIGGVVLNAVFLDSLDSDLERLERINQTLSLMSPEQHARHPQRLRPIATLALRPSRDLGRMAITRQRSLPLALRHLLRGIGATGERGWNLVSYLAFDPGYIASLIDLGYSDTWARRAEVQTFMEGEPSMRPRPERSAASRAAALTDDPS